MWGVGIITYILLAGYPPFYDENNPGDDTALFEKVFFDSVFIFVRRALLLNLLGLGHQRRVRHGRRVLGRRLGPCQGLHSPLARQGPKGAPHRSASYRAPLVQVQAQRQGAPHLAQDERGSHDHSFFLLLLLSHIRVFLQYNIKRKELVQAAKEGDDVTALNKARGSSSSSGSASSSEKDS